MKYTTLYTQLYKSLLALTALSVFLAGQVSAQVDAGALQQGLEKQLPMPSPLALPEPSAQDTLRPTPPKSQSDVTFEIKSFVLEGVNLLPEAKVQEILKPWLGRPVNFDDLQKACDAVMDFYRKSGYTVQAILPPQKIANGVVKILVTEAKLSSVIVDTPNGPTRFSKETAAEYITYANPIGQPLNTRAIERALIILNETPGVMVASQLEPGAKDGETAVRLQLTQPNWYQGKVEANNYGSRTTGANQGVIALNGINPLGIGDQISVNGIYSEGSQYLQGAYSLPVSKDGMRLGISGTYLNYKNVSNYATSSSAGFGDAWTTGASLAYPLIRQQGTNVNVSANYDVKSYMNKLSLTSATISSYNINNASLGISGNHYDSFGGGGVSAGSVTAVFGYLDILGTSQANYGQYTPPSFTKFTFAGNRTQQITEDGRTTAYMAVSGQFSSVNLNSAEQIYMGGPYAVRAYPVAQGGGSQGGIGTVELRHQFPERITGSLFYDIGVVQQYKNVYPDWQGLTNANNTYSLQGAGFGMKWDWEGWNLGAMVAWQIGSNPLYNSSGQAVATDGTTTNPRGWVTGSYQF
ncbi:ShlB/FhaC/HecB family hemolysin secretion/activation protein [Polynucleobacter ibericus]|uniref:ShlB/FhaC/HecB family hemolysin secretion/activation protein n=1 Tax=Polynucleobacter ibericus TaxID=1819725 RepID=UPI001BFDD2B5|nr:ShlB/FhaC/HecB family hemolysin secretion/activation protein [Polynucleobacter ibericus]QWE07878.1 ShlB/FhaC/HecB family hemolysin secretion/activation protein [Polynucleobacter ibericus]